MPPNYREQQSDQGRPLSGHERKGALALASALVLTGAGLGVWAGVGGGQATPKGPCVTVVLASSTGGADVTHCGTQARSWCAAEARTTGPLAALARKACRAKGLLSPRP